MVESKGDMKLFEYHHDALEVVNEAIEKYNPSHVFGLFSGGHDSLCACHIASQATQFDGCIHINTGIGIEETRQFVRDTCNYYEWSLDERHPPVSYEQLVIDQGFPGPGMHWKMYQRLKERCLRDVLRDHQDTCNRRRKIIFVSGRRQLESKRRMVNVGKAVETDLKNPSPRVVWVNPLINWTGSDKDHYIRENDIMRNRVVELLCMSGECLCGSFAQENELDDIRHFYPQAAAEIDRIAANVRAAGKHADWGTPPPCKTKKYDDSQMMLCFSCLQKKAATE